MRGKKSEHVALTFVNLGDPGTHNQSCVCVDEHSQTTGSYKLHIGQALAMLALLAHVSTQLSSVCAYSSALLNMRAF